MKIKLGDLTDIHTGRLDANAASENGKYPFFTCSQEPLKISTYSYDCECVLVAGNGDLNVKYYNGKFDAYQRTYIIQDNSNGSLYMPYLYFFLTKYVEELRTESIGGVIKYIKIGNLTDVVFELPSFEQQKQTVQKLDKVVKLIRLRNQQLKYIDFLIQGRFVEMFGDPYSNPCNWDCCAISDVIQGKIANGFFTRPANYTQNGNASVICVGDIVNRKYAKTTDLRRASVSEMELEKYRVQYGDILFCRSSLVKEGIGKTSIIPESINGNFIYECHVIKVPLDTKIIFPEYLQALLETKYFRNLIIQKSKTATMTTISQNAIASIEVYVPPIKVQKKFVDFSKQIDKSKVVIQKSIDKLQLLFDSLMQQYFG